MNIESLPPDVLGKIFHYLSFKEQTRNARVSKLFKSISTSAIAETEELIIDEDLVAFAISGDFKSFVANCSPKLRRIIVKLNPDGQSSQYQIGTEYLKLIIRLLTNETFPRVIDVQFGPEVGEYRGFELIKRCPNLKFLTYNGGCRVVFPANEIDCHEKLEKLRITKNGGDTDLVNIDRKTGKLSIYEFNENLVILIIKTIPNLKEISLDRFGGNVRKLDEVFGICQNLESLKIWNHSRDDHNLESFSKFWRLSALKNLNLKMMHCSITDAAIKKLVYSFPYLETLNLRGDLEITDDAINALCTLSNLRSLKLFRDSRHYDMKIFFCAAFDRFSECENLTALELCQVSITPESFVKLVRSCNKLTDLKLHSILGVHSPEKAIEILESFSDLRGETLMIDLEKQTILCLGTDGCVGVWDSKEVKETLQKLEKKIWFG